MIEIISEACKEADKHYDWRSMHSVLAHAMSELGELAEEVNIHTGLSIKQSGPDGVVGEAIDTILSLIDLIYIYDRDGFDENYLKVVAAKKCEKWLSSINPE